MDLKIFVDADPDERLIRVMQRDVAKNSALRISSQTIKAPMTFPSVAYWQPTLAVSHSALLPYVPVPPKQGIHSKHYISMACQIITHILFIITSFRPIIRIGCHRCLHTERTYHLLFPLLRNGPHGREVITLQEMVPSPQGPTDKREHGNIPKH